MATTTTTTTKTKQVPEGVLTGKADQAIVVTPKNALVSNLDMSALEQDAGKGSQNVTNDDIQTPIISILQANSPQCKKSDGKYIKGASEGMLYNNVTNEVYDGEAGIVIVPCFFEKVYIEWKPNRGGFVEIHGADTPLKDQIKWVQSPEGKEVPTLPNGNNLIETNQHYVLILKEDGSFEAAVLAMSSSALSASRKLNTLMGHQKKQKADGSFFKPATYASQYRLYTSARQNDQYSWFGWQVESLGDVPDMNIYYAGRALEEEVNAGTVRVKQEQVDGGPINAKAEDSIPF